MTRDWQTPPKTLLRPPAPATGHLRLWLAACSADPGSDRKHVAIISAEVCLKLDQIGNSLSLNGYPQSYAITMLIFSYC